MKKERTTLAVLALLGVTLVLAGCPRHLRPPHPHRAPHPRLPLDAMLQMEQQKIAQQYSKPVTVTAAARHV